MRAGVRDGKFPRQYGDELHMLAQLEVEIEWKEQTDHDPDIDIEVDTAADADEFCKAGRMRRNPDEIELPTAPSGFGRAYVTSGRALSFVRSWHQADLLGRLGD